MMDEKARILDLRKELEKYSIEYYVYDNPSVTRSRVRSFDARINGIRREASRNAGCE